MSLIVEFRLSKPGFRRAPLFGDYPSNITVLDLGIITLMWLGDDVRGAFKNFLNSQMDIKQFLAANAPIVRLERKKARAKFLAQAHAERLSSAAIYQDSIDRLTAENARLHSRNSDLEAALRVLRPEHSSPSNFMGVSKKTAMRRYAHTWR